MTPARAAALACCAAFAALSAAAAEPRLTPRPPRALPHGKGETHCAYCHSTATWSSVSFAHDKTGFPLRGVHASVECKACHAVDFQTPLGTRCIACHRDGHAGEFGARCEGCHDAERDWKPKFDADAHRKTNFPLFGRHALIPCQECHQDVRDRGFTRAAVQCIGCHQADYARTALTSLDHQKAGFGVECRECHGFFRWQGAVFAAHDACFLITSGPHSGIRCLDCHTTLQGTAAIGTCTTGAFSCTRCHDCARAQEQHRDVPGFQCKEEKCYECHRFTSAGFGLGASPLRGR